MKWISSISLSIPFAYAVIWDIKLNEADQFYLIMVFLLTLASMYNRMIGSNHSRWVDQTMICSVHLYISFEIKWGVLFIAVFFYRYIYIIVTICGLAHIWNTNREWPVLRLLRLVTALSGCGLFLYNCKHDVWWNRWLWHILGGLYLTYPLLLHDYGSLNTYIHI